MIAMPNMANLVGNDSYTLDSKDPLRTHGITRTLLANIDGFPCSPDTSHHPDTIAHPSRTTTPDPSVNAAEAKGDLINGQRHVEIRQCDSY